MDVHTLSFPDATDSASESGIQVIQAARTKARLSDMPLDVVKHIFFYLCLPSDKSVVSRRSYRDALLLGLTCKSFYRLFTSCFNTVAAMPASFTGHIRADGGIRDYGIGNAINRPSFTYPMYFLDHSSTNCDIVEVEEGEGAPGETWQVLSPILPRPSMLEAFSDVKHLYISQIVNMTDEEMAGVVRACPQLTVLRAPANCRLSNRSLLEFCKLRSLHTLDLSFCCGFDNAAAFYFPCIPALRKLSICRWFITDGFFYNLLTSSGNLHLEDVVISSCTDITDLSMAYLAMRLSLTLRRLQARGCRRMRHTSGVCTLVKRCKALETLDIGYNMLASGCTAFWIMRCTSLRHLSVENCISVRDAAVESITKLRDLEAINVAGCVDLTDDAARMLAKCPKLKTVNVSACRRLTDAAVIALAQLPALEVLLLADCKRLTDDSADAVLDSANTPLATVDITGCPQISSPAIVDLSVVVRVLIV